MLENLKKLVGLLVSASLFCILVFSLFAQEESSVDLSADIVNIGKEVRTFPKRLTDYGLPGLEEKVYLTTMVPWDVVQLIEFLAHKGGLKNLIIAKGVSGLTTKLKFDGVSIGDALEIVLSVNNLAYEVKGDIISIMTDAEYRVIHGVSFYDKKRVKIVDLKYADATHVAGMLASIKSDIGTIVSDQITGSLILIDTPEKIKEMQAVIRNADIETVSRVLPTETRTFILQYSDVENMKKEVSAVLTKEGGSLRADRRTKSLIVTDLPHNMKRIENLIKTFDKRPQQVFIEAKIIEVTLSDDFSLGINWNHLMNGVNPRFSLQTISQPRLSSRSAASLTYNTIVADGDLSLVLQALKSIGDTKIISNPQIAVMDGEEAMIEVVENQPYKEITLESGTTNITGVTYLFKKVGVQLAVTPKINEEKFINLAIKPEISSISQWYDGAPQEGTPVIKKSYAETTVMVKDNITIIIGGMIKEQKSTSNIKIPLLGSIPLLGGFFRSKSVSSVKTETVVFMTPRIISGEKPFLRMKDIKKRPKPLRSLGSGSRKKIKPVR